MHLNGAPCFFMLYTNHTNIKTWAEEDRPREKLLHKGHQALSDAELLAILLGSGTQNCTAVELARRVLSVANNNLTELGRVSLEQLTNIKGIGEAKAIIILSALELGRRRQRTEALKEKSITTSRQAYELLAPSMGDLKHEEFWLIFLDRKSNLIKYKKATQGGFAGTIVDTRQIFQWALAEQAASIILAHNHPSGTLKPSSLDINITMNLVKAGRILDIRVSDHLIITNNGFYSFADQGDI